LGDPTPSALGAIVFAWLAVRWRRRNSSSTQVMEGTVFDGSAILLYREIHSAAWTTRRW